MSAPQNDRGFSLIEVIAAIAVIAGGAALAVSYRGAPEAADLRSAETTVVAALAGARLHASASGTPASLDPTTLFLPPTVVAALSPAGPIEFLPDGELAADSVAIVLESNACGCAAEQRPRRTIVVLHSGALFREND